MTDAISNAGKPTTPMGYQDRKRPLPMIYGDQLWKRLSSVHEDQPGEAVMMMQDFEKLVKTLKSYEVDQLWEKVENKFTRGQGITTKATTDDAKVLTALSLFYNAANIIDQNSVTSNDLLILREIYDETQVYMESKFRTNMSNKDKRVFDNISNTIADRIDAIKDRFNELVETGQMGGGKIP